MTLEQIKRKAQADADRTGETLVVLNLNPVGSPLYVIRKWSDYDDAIRAGRRDMVCKVSPA